ncbi:hypothetical protein BaRGS_00031119 [Batillaria attramentaria]|uniref:Gustatory receptor n=1 Tax=Batillaria attramentaria TaxID=370345 RepID=A0ABD0JRX2_9CAEN
MKRPSLSAAVRPLLIVSFLSGTYNPTVARKRGRRLLTVLKTVIPILCCVLLTVKITSTVRRLLHKGQDGTGSIASLYRTTSLLGEVYMVFVLSAVGSKAFRHFLKCFQAYCSRFDRHREGFCHVLKPGIVAVLLTVVYLFVSAYSAYGAAARPCFYDRSSVFWPLDLFSCQPPVAFLTTFFTSQVYSIGFMLYFTTWRILMTEATDLVSGLREAGETTLTEKPEVLERFRLRHAHVCELIVKANACVRHIMAAIFGAGVPCILFVVHGFVYKQLSANEFQIMAMWFVGLVSRIVIIMLTGVALNLKMHQPVELLFQLNVEKMAGKGSDVVCGTILTYAVVIIQFQPTPGAENNQMHPHTDAVAVATPSLLTTDIQDFNVTTM